jgi:hypothetical protein
MRNLIVRLSGSVRDNVIYVKTEHLETTDDFKWKDLALVNDFVTKSDLKEALKGAAGKFNQQREGFIDCKQFNRKKRRSSEAVGDHVAMLSNRILGGTEPRTTAVALIKIR